MLHSLCYRQLHLDVHACEQFAKTGGELGAGGVGADGCRGAISLTV